MMLCSTASTTILVGDRLVVANVGDSMAVICRGKKGDHKPGQTDDRRRIEEAGGFVMWAARDRLLKQVVVADPEIQVETVDGSFEFLILASDGLWDVTNEVLSKVISFRQSKSLSSFVTQLFFGNNLGCCCHGGLSKELQADVGNSARELLADV
ncbi:hypothetical protein ZIOFF_007964 [Zingiber officinale]|uniref:protein-serine/threonine phosphatase n=1 Tax=Zingiber officinale TaxID=94328 RepID=A0A8J5I5R0_ZINOF|nr:hypothetical protein ZIOFF_007964 [Zingiber officinale]